ncbi:MAG TPA: hypothetical protein VHE55_10320 [Fimbriimonadaceae bacterium]|nr:hypothetical protein [Fimbriimonadaceae bacterium]
MRNSFLAAATLGAAVLSASAFCQVVHTAVDATPYNISLKGSVYWPIDDNLRHVDHMFAGAGLEYLFPTQLIRGSETFMELDALLHTTASSNLTILPLTINQRFYSKPGSSLFGHNGRSYFYLGGGVTWFDPRGAAKLTFHGGIGSDLGPRTFLEAAIYISEQDSNMGLRNSGVIASLGYRF